jgi:hypothetical protein
MAEKEPAQRAFILDLEPAGLGATGDTVTTVQEFLQRFGYVDEEQSVALAAMDDTTSTALARYQRFHALEPTGIFDEPTREMMSRSRCLLPDRPDPSAPTFVAGCAWNKTSLTYAFSSGTADVAGDEERAAVRNAFVTWSRAVQIAFREVGTGDDPDILIGWTNANCGDADMTGVTLAHADYPPGCGYFGNARPRPFHFDDQEHAWCIGAVVNQYDVESTALHEIGHLLGLQHSGVAGAVMFPTASPNTTKRALAPDDIAGIQSLYPPTGPIFVRHSGRCLDIAGISSDNGAEAIQWDYWGGGNQIFKVEWVEGQLYRLTAQHTGKVIDVSGISTDDGAALIQWDWWGGGNQKFRLDPAGHGYFCITASHSNKVMDVSAISQDNGARVIQWSWWGGQNQQWRLAHAPITSKHSGRVLDVANRSSENGAAVIQWDYWGGGNQKLRLDPVSDGYYRIMVDHSGRCLDVEGISTDNGARIIQWDYWGGDNQKFRPEPLGSGYYLLRAKHSGRALDVYGWSNENGAQIVQWDAHGGDNQAWRL